jgi:methylated-DNA-protein-cysteine methyltransferase related protein
VANVEQLWEIIRSIPVGQCSSYGDVGQALDRPLSGLLVGRFLTNAPPDVPWWRVVGSTGALLIGKKSPHLAIEQALRLEAEGVLLVNEIVPMDRYRYLP